MPVKRGNEHHLYKDPKDRVTKPYIPTGKPRGRPSKCKNDNMDDSITTNIAQLVSKIFEKEKSSESKIDVLKSGVPSKRSRGRPPKLKNKKQNVYTPTGKPRGRPKLYSNAERKQDEAEVSKEYMKGSSKGQYQNVKRYVPTGIPRGRPKLVKDEIDDVHHEIGSELRKLKTNISNRKSSGKFSNPKKLYIPTGKPRGRPKKLINDDRNESGFDSSNQHDLYELQEDNKWTNAKEKKYIPTGKPRGRPRKSSIQKCSSYIPTGKPRGRPKKITEDNSSELRSNVSNKHTKDDVSEAESDKVPLKKYATNNRLRGRPKKGKEGSSDEKDLSDSEEWWD